MNLTMSFAQQQQSLSAVVALFLLVGSPFCLGNDKGAPPASCETMEPEHESSPSVEPCPYFTDLRGQTEMFSNATLSFTLQTNSTSKDFAGFLIMGFDDATGQVLGAFQRSTNDVRLLDCLNKKQIAATHYDKNHKHSVDLMWKPPVDFEGTVSFYTSFVETKRVYWVKEKSIGSIRIIRVGEPSSSTTTPATTTPPPEVMDVYDGCGTTKGCYGTETNCTQSRSCKMLTTYRPMEGNSSFYEIEILGILRNPDSYLAVGFSKDMKMGNDSVIECVNYKNALAAYNSFNAPGDTNTRTDKVEGFRLLSANYSNGYIYCKVLQPAKYTVNNLSFDLDAESYYFLSATGPTGEKNIKEHSIKLASSYIINMGPANPTPEPSAGHRPYHETSIGACLTLALLTVVISISH